MQHKTKDTSEQISREIDSLFADLDDSISEIAEAEARCLENIYAALDTFQALGTRKTIETESAFSKVLAGIDERILNQDTELNPDAAQALESAQQFLKSIQYGRDRNVPGTSLN